MSVHRGVAFALCIGCVPTLEAPLPDSGQTMLIFQNGEWIDARFSALVNVYKGAALFVFEDEPLALGLANLEFRPPLTRAVPDHGRVWRFDGEGWKPGMPPEDALFPPVPWTACWEEGGCARPGARGAFVCDLDCIPDVDAPAAPEPPTPPPAFDCPGWPNRCVQESCARDTFRIPGTSECVAFPGCTTAAGTITVLTQAELDAAVSSHAEIIVGPGTFVVPPLTQAITLSGRDCDARPELTFSDPVITVPLTLRQVEVAEQLNTMSAGVGVARRGPPGARREAAGRTPSS